MDAKLPPLVAIIGAGPAGLFAAKTLTAEGYRVVIFNRDIKPGGLAEYGIYPEKHKMKEGLRTQFRSILASDQVCYLGNVTIGSGGDFSIGDILKMGFQAVLVTVGAQAEKRLGISGEDLEGVFHSKDVVYHYNKLPPFSKRPFHIGKRVAIIGVGNVMLDISRWLIDNVKVHDIIAIARRGPAEVKFTRKELEDVVGNLDMDQLNREIDRCSPAMVAVGQNPDESKEIYRIACEKASSHDSPTRFTFRFLSSPRRIITDIYGRVAGLEVEENKLVQQGTDVKASGIGKIDTLPIDTVIFAIGDVVDQPLGLPVVNNRFEIDPNPEYPVDGISYEIINRNTNYTGPKFFVGGWAREASTGVVGIARRDGTNAALAIKTYLEKNEISGEKQLDEVCSYVTSHIKKAVTYREIQKLEEEEQRMAVTLGVEEFKFDSNEKMIKFLKAK